MNVAPRPVYLFLSSEKDFAAFSRILTKTQKTIETIESIDVLELNGQRSFGWS